MVARGTQLVSEVLSRFQESEKIRELLALIKSGEKDISVAGLVGSMSSLLSASILLLCDIPILLIASSSAQAESVLDDLTTLINPELVSFMPPGHLHPFDTSPLALGPQNERFDAFLRFSQTKASVLVTQAEALLERVPDRNWIKNHTIKLEIGESVPRDIMLSEITGAGYLRERLIDNQGQYSVRGNIIDLFPFGHEYPLRIEFDDEKIVSLRRFDPANQRSIKAINSTNILLGEEPQNSESGIIDLISEETIVFWVGVEEIEGRIKKFRERASNAYKQGMSRNNLPVKDLYLTTEYIKGKSLNNCQISWHELGRGSQVDLDFNGRFPDSFPHTVERFPEHIDKYCQRDYKVWICADTTGEKDRLEELLFDSKVEKARLVTPTLSAGFVLSEEKMAILTSNELFMRRRMRARHTRFRRRTVVFDRSSLKRGDLVVHADYGIGKYEGLQKVKVRDHPRECLRIKYADDTILYIKVEHFGLVEKYTRMDNANPALSKINSREWERAKKKTKKAIEDIAGELVRLYAKRKIAKGVAFSVDSLWQGEMESSFEFEDTPDQVTSIVEIKKDLELSSPMDRLLCGDVGFGKTEVAIRAAFKVVQDSHQVAILVPTTILAQQHYETFRERLASYPVRIEVLSRFRSRSEQKDTVKDLALGKVDILIGTHRLLSKDVGFKELGLLVIDEEHRFGVKHKERLKSLKTNVDVLTMTATPIPRTLHMALMGARDTSQINTPPIDRLPIQTEVYSWSEKLIKDAILREVDRNGQVFFVHNRVQSILAVKGMLERIVPGINYGVAHGQMPERQLEKIMFEFMHGRYDVLITTMIIESGLDIPNANTLIVNRADRFGLAQLYQLRGRIGRSNRQAYAYLLTPPKLTVAGLARKRLSTLTELTDLGSGFKIAMRDLELRGAGNLLGAQQSGFINAIGFSLYTRILNDVIQKLKGEAPSRSAKSESEEIKIEFIGPALFPSTYIEDSDTRYNFYKKLSNVKDISEIDEIENELVDRFGSIPEKADNLLSLARIKAMGRILNFSRIMFRQTYLSCQIDLPSDLTESQKILGKIVSQAAPEQIEFKMGKKVEIIHRYKLKDHLKASLKFLRHLSRKGILQD